MNFCYVCYGGLKSFKEKLRTKSSIGCKIPHNGRFLPTFKRIRAYHGLKLISIQVEPSKNE